MSVLIKGMEIPESCHVCVAGYGGCCYIAPPESDGVCPDHGRAEFCPIEPVPPHLINFDKPYTFTIEWDGKQLKGNMCGSGVD